MNSYFQLSLGRTKQAHGQRSATPLCFHAFTMEGQRLPSSQVSRQWKFRRWQHLVLWWSTTEVIFPSLLLIQNALEGALANSVETNALITIFVQKSITTFTRPMTRQGMKIKPSSVVIAEALKNADRKGCNLSGEEKLALAKKILLTEEDVEMWLQHLSDVSTRRKEVAKKATATRRQKNKGHTEGNTKESSGTFYIKGLKNKFSSVLCFWLK